MWGFRNDKVQLKQIYIFIFIFVFLTSFAFANPKVVSVTMVPSNPVFGDLVQITVNYCSQNYQKAMIDIAISSQNTKTSAELSGNGQVFVVSVLGVDVASSQPALNGGQIGWQANGNPGGPNTGNCTDCGGNAQSTLRSVTYAVHVPPASYFPGCNVTKLYLYVGMKDNSLAAPEWTGSSVCGTDPPALSWNIGTIPKSFIISKRTEGVVQAQNDLVLFSIDYEYWNGPLTITDIVPPGGQLTLVSYGPSVINGVASTYTAGTFTWKMQDRTGMPGTANGTLWMLYKVNTNPPIPLTEYKNLATGTMGAIVKTASATNIVGQAAISITKDQSEANPNYGDMITYYLTYNVNGMQLVAYQPFDEIPAAVYGAYAPTSTNVVPGWTFIPEGDRGAPMTVGQWTVSDACGTGDKIITGSVNHQYQYPALLYDGLPATSHLCGGIIQSDVMINPNGYEGSDALLIFRSDGANAYGVGISVDKNLGGYTGGHIEFQACAPGCFWPNPTILAPDPIITANKWWTVKVWVDPTNQYHFMAKAWPKGNPEPSGYQIEWTDPDAARKSTMNCNNGAAWKAGFGQQGGDDGANWAHDSYNNFVIYNPRTSESTTVWDTVPNAVLGVSDGSITYVGEQGNYPGAQAGGVVTFTLSNIANEGGTLTWWGQVNSCNPIINEAWIGGTNETPQKSNQVTAFPVCPTPVITMHKTANVASAMVGDTLTFELWACNSAAGPATANPFNIWDDVPGFINFLGFDATLPPTGTNSAGHLSWVFPSLAASACTTHVKWYGKITGLPMIGASDYFAVLPNTKSMVEKMAFLGLYGK